MYVDVQFVKCVRIVSNVQIPKFFLTAWRTATCKQFSLINSESLSPWTGLVWEYFMWTSLIIQRLTETDRVPCLWHHSSLGLHWRKSGPTRLCNKDISLETAVEWKRKIKHGPWNEYHDLFRSDILFNNLLSWRCPVVNVFKAGSI